MNIQEAKAEIARTFRAYTRRTPDGAHRIPPEKQRPVLLIGPPGIGKTAIMKQIARETGCGLVAYSMTHHTRQSAIGLPFIAHRDYGGQRRAVTEYTMSEIVAAIYDYMEATGKRSGILFLDEINCVSETLTPVMLQLLQNKTFGNVPLPENWVIVAAGNPPEYNRSVRELDMVTLDRVKHIDVEADLPIWRRYALEMGVHPAVRTYLSVYPDHFYNITNTDRGQLFVTARGWEDLSLMLTALEEDGETVDEKWFLQYLQHDAIARSFGLYYDLFRHFADRLTEADADSFSLSALLLRDPDALAARSSTECLALAAMLYSPVAHGAARLWEDGKRLARRRELASLLPPLEPESGIREFFDQKWRALEVKTSHGVMKPDEELRENACLTRLERDVADWQKLPRDARPPFADFEGDILSREAAARNNDAEQLVRRVESAYAVLEACPQGRSARLYLTSDLAASPACAALLDEHPSQAYQKYLDEIEA